MGVSIDRRGRTTVRRATAAARRVARGGVRRLERAVRTVLRRNGATRRHPTPRELFRSGRALERTGLHAAAIDAYRAAIDRNPTRAHWHYRLGRTLERARDWGAAADAYGRALALDDSRPAWRQRHAAALRRAHDRDRLDHAVAAMLAREPDMRRSSAVCCRPTLVGSTRAVRFCGS